MDRFIKFFINIFIGFSLPFLFEFIGGVKWKSENTLPL